MKRQTIIAVFITIIAMWIAHRLDMKSYERMCKDTVEWAIQDTSDATLAACEDRIDELAAQCNISIEDLTNE